MPDSGNATARPIVVFTRSFVAATGTVREVLIEMTDRLNPHVTPDLMGRYLAAERHERHAILNEIIRLEPVVGHLYRRAQGEFEIADGDQTWTVAAGDLLDLSVRTANTDPAAVGEAPLGLCPVRPLPSGVNPAVLSFGDGAHKCPGQPLAILESDVFLTRLLALKPTIVTEPKLGWDDLIAGYWLRNFQLSFPATI